jgi:hypothetical protein
VFVPCKAHSKFVNTAVKCFITSAQVIGSEVPWFEAILLSKGAKMITTFDYVSIESKHPQAGKVSRFIYTGVNHCHCMDKLKLTGLNLGRVFNSRLGRACIGHAIVHITKQPNLKLKTWPKQLLGYLLLAFVLPAIDNDATNV